VNIDQLKADLTRDEGTKLKPYTDTRRKLSIGTGRNLDDVGISPDEADLMLTNDISNVVASLDKAFPWWSTLSDARQRALANMCFNLGFSGLLAFRQMLDALKAGDFKTAAQQALNSEWAKQVGARAQRIATLMENG
jgi:lysozyme